MNKKYELTEESRTLSDGTVLHRIRALSDFTIYDGIDVSKGDLGGFIEREENLSRDGTSWVYDDACVYGNARVSGDACVSDDACVYGDACVSDVHDYAVYKNTWSSGRWFTYTRSNGKWNVGCFYGDGDELIAKAYKDSELSGKCYESIVKAQEAIDKEIKKVR